jgi:hypothetical protein
VSTTSFAKQPEDGSFRNFITPVITAARYGKSEKTLANDRAAGRGFPYYKSGRTVLYDMDECDALVLATRQNGNAA